MPVLWLRIIRTATSCPCKRTPKTSARSKSSRRNGDSRGPSQGQTNNVPTLKGEHHHNRGQQGNQRQGESRAKRSSGCTNRALWIEPMRTSSQSESARGEFPSFDYRQQIDRCTISDTSWITAIAAAGNHSSASPFPECCVRQAILIDGHVHQTLFGTHRLLEKEDRMLNRARLLDTPCRGQRRAAHQRSV